MKNKMETQNKNNVERENKTNLIEVMKSAREIIVPALGFKGRIKRSLKQGLSHRSAVNDDAIKDYPSVVDVATRCYSECYSRGNRCSDENSKMGEIIQNIGYATDAAARFYVPLMSIESMGSWGGYLPREHLLETRVNDMYSFYYIGGILNAGVILPKVSSELDISKKAEWKNYSALLAIAGNLVNKRSSSGRTHSVPALLCDSKYVDMSEKAKHDKEVSAWIPNLLDKYERIFGISFPAESRVHERLEGVVGQSEHYYDCLLDKRVKGGNE